MNAKDIIRYLWTHGHKWDACKCVLEGPFITVYAYGVHYLRRGAQWVLDVTRVHV